MSAPLLAKHAPRFEIFVALRYLMAKRKQAVISVITAISVLGVAAGVMALIIALAINNGFRNTLQRTLVRATAHVSILEKQPGEGIRDYVALVEKLRRLPHVRGAAPTLYGTVFLAGPVRSSGAVLKGIDLRSEMHRADVAALLKQGSIEDLAEEDGVPGLIIGARLAETTGMVLHSRVKVISPQGELTPFGPRPSFFSFRVAGIFESQFFELDSAWAFTSLASVQKVLAVGDVANAVELKVEPLEQADQVARAAETMIGTELAATSWTEQNRQIFGALRMERIVTVITIGLIQLVAALNILISLTMMVMEKHRDIAVLMSMGATRQQIRRIFLYQGAMIGGVGAVLGLALGYGLSLAAEHYRWVPLDQQVYSLSYVPFEPRWIDGIWVGGGALAVSLLATLYPAHSATRILPAEALRYE
ncbi:MAG: ABC transporter permease [Bryobacteraceae bacterium]|nr:ABC transporter permease [Bryobacteraceae bacterium]MDW8380370.1 ABC transporter permease [Bryobacterales bacterium]